MNVNNNFFFDVLLLGAGLFVNAYFIYGKAKRKSLVGGYRPGVEGYDVFIKLINNTKYFYVSIVATLFFLINVAIGAKAVLNHSGSHSILIVAPIVVAISMLATFGVILPAVFKKK